MNITHVKELFDETGCRLTKIFAAQSILHERYIPVYRDNGFYCPVAQPSSFTTDNKNPGPRFSINDRHDQAYLKHLAWCVMEELAEAYEAWHHDQHRVEEVADALHFYVELHLLAGISPDDWCGADLAQPCRLQTLFSYMLMPVISGVERHHHGFTQFLGCAMNALKQKPWKNTHVLTDEAVFRRNLLNSVPFFLAIANAAGLNHSSLFQTYFKKHQVNDFRITTNY